MEQMQIIENECHESILRQSAVFNLVCSILKIFKSCTQFASTHFKSIF